MENKPMTLRQLLEQLNKLEDATLDSEIWYVDISTPCVGDEIIIDKDKLGLVVTKIY